MKSFLTRSGHRNEAAANMFWTREHSKAAAVTADSCSIDIKYANNWILKQISTYLQSTTLLADIFDPPDFQNKHFAKKVFSEMF